MPDFIHLHNHTDFSLLDGAASISSLVARAAEYKMSHLAITDHGNMFGALKFYNECRKNDISPIIGCEFYMAPGSRLIKSGTEKGNKYYHLILLAKNLEGYQNLIILSSKGYTEGFYYKPRIDEEILRNHSRGLICLSACIAGEIPSLILRGERDRAKQRIQDFQEIFTPGHFYLELQDHGLKEQKIANPALAELSRETGVPLVATNDIHYTKKSDANAQDILLCIGTNKKKTEENRLVFGPHEFYLKSQDEMFSLFRDVPSALKNTMAIAEQCSLEIPKPGPMLPVYTIPPQFSSPEEYLRHLSYEGMKHRYPNTAEDLIQRLEYELEIIISMGFTGYFLIVWDFIHYAKEHNIPVGPGRGSGAGSIVAYSLQITDIDPIKYGLLFERFLNPERVSMPDFDIDFCFEKRQQVIDYVTEKYGKEKVGQIITFGTLKARAVIRDVARVLDIPYAESDSIAKLVPSGPKTNLSSALEAEPKLRELEERGGVHKELIDTSRRLEGLNRHASTHAAGIVIGKEELTKYVPLYRDAKTGSISTQYTMELLEDCGLVKMDFLGLKTLTLIRNTEKLIKKRIPDFSLKNIPEEDVKTFEMLGEGKSTCIFQFESPGMQAILKRAKPTKIEDLIALNALYRPGPMDNIDQFIDSKLGKTPITYPLPELETVLKETYGVIVYQEQVMEIARIVAGYSLGQADILRRAMGKKKVMEMAKQKAAFLAGAAEKGYTKKQAEDIFNLLIPFAGYGFNKSHAAAYSILAYRTAYLKANYPAEFMAANLSNEINSTDKLTDYIAESNGMGLEVLPPDVNLSEKKFSVVDGKIIYGLMGIKNVGSAAVDELIARRREGGSFSDIEDFFMRIDLKTVNHKVLESFIQSGVFDKLFPGRRKLFQNLDHILEIIHKRKEEIEFGQTSLFSTEEKSAGSTIDLEEIPEWTDMERLQFEKDNLGFYFSGHPLDKYRKLWEKAVTLDISMAERAVQDKTYNFLGMMRNQKEIMTKKGKMMCFSSLEDYNGLIECVFFPDIWSRYKYIIDNNPVIGIRGKIDRKKDEPKVIVEEVVEPEDLDTSEPEEFHIRFLNEVPSEDDLITLRSILIEHKGSCPVFIHMIHPETAKEITIKAAAQIKVAPSDAFLDQIKEFPRIKEVWRL